MVTKAKAPWFARWGNSLTTPLLRAGVKLVGPGNYPMYLLTVRGRKSGQPRTVPIVLLEQHGQRYLAATYGMVDWVRNLRAAVESGDLTTLMQVLSENVILWTDGGGKTRKALLRPMSGREVVARMTLASKRIWPQNARIELREVNGQTALVVRVDGRAWSCLSIEVEHGQIR